MSIDGLSNSYGKAYSNTASVNTSATAQPSTRDLTKAGKATEQSSSSIVTLSTNAPTESRLGMPELSFAEVGMAARGKLDALKQQAAERTSTTASALNLNKVDYSSFSDQELAAMNLNSSGTFSEVEQIHAQGVLGERLRVSLETFRNVTDQGDRRGHTMTINALYTQMTPEIRSALKWTPAMMESNNRILASDSRHLGNLPVSTVLANLQATQKEGGLAFDGARFHGSIDLTKGSQLTDTLDDDAASLGSKAIAVNEANLTSAIQSTVPADKPTTPGHALMLSRLFGSIEAGPVALPGSENPLIAAYLMEQDRDLIVRMYDYSIENNIDLDHVDALAFDLGLHRSSPNLVRNYELYDLNGRRIHVAFSDADRQLAERIARASPSSSLDQGFLQALQSPGGRAVNFEFLERMVNVFSSAPTAIDTDIGEYDTEKNKRVVTVDDEVTMPVPVADFSRNGTSKTWTIESDNEQAGPWNLDILRNLNQRTTRNDGYLSLLLGFARANHVDSRSFADLLLHYPFSR